MREAFGANFDVPDGYLNTASIGIPPTSTVHALTTAVSGWGSGLDSSTDFEPAIASTRESFARLIGSSAERVTIGVTTSQLIGLVAANLPDTAKVLLAKQDFTSVSFPFAAQCERGVTITEVELDEIPDRAAEFDLVAVSVVQSRDGSIVDLDALRAIRDRHGTRVLLDATQAAGWLPLQLDWADWVVATGYKWLLSPRGAGWMAVHPDAPRLISHSACWYGAEQPYETTYGLPLRAADGPRRLDVSPTWFAHVAAAVSMSWLAGLDLAAVRDHCVGLANAFRASVGMPAGNSAIVSVPLPGGDTASAVAELTAAGVDCAVRAGRVRLAFHLYNTDADGQLAADALRGNVLIRPLGVSES